MRQFLALFLTLTMAATPLLAGERGSRALSGWFDVSTAEGWRGRRYMDGSMIFAEEFDSTGNGRIDVWRFYRRGILTSEERDTNGDGRVDLVTRYDPNTGLVTAVLRDTNRRGVNDIEVERTGPQRWVVYQDRNLDGTTDRIVYINAPADLFERHGIDPASTADISAAIPRGYWTEMWSDDGFSGSITDYFRYSNRGVLSHYGRWNGRRIVWNRVSPDFAPIPKTPTAPPPAAGLAGTGAAPQQQPMQPTPAPLPPADRPGTVRDPFDLAAGRSDIDPYYGMEGPPAALPGEPEPGGLGPEAGTPFMTQPAAGPARTGTDAWSGNHYFQGESSARAVPARMRPPGQTRTQ